MLTIHILISFFYSWLCGHRLMRSQPTSRLTPANLNTGLPQEHNMSSKTSRSSSITSSFHTGPPPSDDHDLSNGSIHPAQPLPHHVTKKLSCALVVDSDEEVLLAIPAKATKVSPIFCH